MTETWRWTLRGVPGAASLKSPGSWFLPSEKDGPTGSGVGDAQWCPAPPAMLLRPDQDPAAPSPPCTPMGTAEEGAQLLRAPGTDPSRSSREHRTLTAWKRGDLLGSLCAEINDSKARPAWLGSRGLVLPARPLRSPGCFPTASRPRAGAPALLPVGGGA